jgi:RNA polymerase sigma-70 factor (ECF subfamily)
MNLALTHRRKATRAPTLSLDAPDEQGRTLVPRIAGSASHHPAARIDSAEIRTRVADALRNLDEDHRAVVVLRDLEGFDYAEIADILEIPRGTVKSRLARGREALRQALAPLVNHGESMR